MINQDWRNVLKSARHKRSGEKEESKTKGTRATVQAVAPMTERVYSSDFGGGTPGVAITHPYHSVRSWHRIMPEPGTTAVVMQRADTQETEIAYYWSVLPERRIADYYKGIGHYRALQPGEQEIMSSGLAAMFWSRRGNLQFRGGVTRSWLSNDDLEAGQKAATHRRLLQRLVCRSIQGESKRCPHASFHQAQDAHQSRA